MKKLLFLCILTVFASRGVAQELSMSNLFLENGRGYICVDSAKLDNSYLTVIYKHERKMGTAQKPAQAWCNIQLLVGKKALLQTNMNLLAYDNEKEGGMLNKMRKRWKNCGNHVPAYFGELLYFTDTDSVRVTCCALGMGGSDIPYVYQEPMPHQQWELRDETDTVAGYACRTAVSKFGGREWTAWYTTEIPVSAGPWKLNGLPGLILRARDSEGIYAFECIQISTTPEQIYDYEPDDTRQVTKSQYIRLERNYYAAPGSAMGGKTLVGIGPNNEKTTIDLNQPLPYHPIEHE